MILQKSDDSDSKHRKMVHIHRDIHSEIQLLSIKTGIPIHKLVDMLLKDALTRVELTESEDKE